MFRLWAEMSSPELKGTENVILPVGAVEQHGSHLPVGTDMYLVEGFVRELLEDRTMKYDWSILPVLPLGKSIEHASFPGTVTLSAHTLYSLIHDIAQSIAQSGAKRLVILSGHGGNNGVVDTSLFDIRREYGIDSYSLHLGRLYPRSGVEGCSLPESMHAGFAETSCMMYFSRGRFDRLLEKRPEKMTHTAGFDFLNSLNPDTGFGWATEDITGDGYIGDVTRASAEYGEAIVKGAVRSIIAELNKIVEWR